MNIDIYDLIFNALKTANNSAKDQLYGNSIVTFAPAKPTYPLTVFDEIRNMRVGKLKPYDNTTDLGYRVDIFAKTKGSVHKQKIARTVAKFVTDFLERNVGLTQTSYNTFAQDNDDSLYHIVLIFNGTVSDYRAKFIKE